MNKENFIKKLEELVKIDGSTKEGANKTIEKYKELFPNIQFKEFEQNGYKAIYSIIEKPTILLLGHLDTVTATEKWTKNPFKLTIEGNKAYGLGSVDMKSGAIVIGEVFTSLLEENKKDIAILLDTDEETGGMNTALPLSRIFGKDVKFTIAAEPINFEIGIACKGVEWLKVTALGKSTHASKPKTGINAIEKMIEFYEKFKKLDIWQINDETMGKTTYSLDKIIAGDKLNQVPDKCEAYIDIRFTKTVGGERVFSEIKKLESEYIKIEEIIRNSFSFADKNSIYVKALKASAEKFGKTKLIVKEGSNDGKHFCAQGAEAVVFGQVGSDAHTVDEYVEIDSCIRVYEALIDFFKSFQS